MKTTETPNAPVKGLSLVAKIVAIILGYVVPLIAVTLFFLVKGPNKDIEFGTQELRGDEYLRPLLQVLNLVPIYQVQQTTRASAKETEAEIEKAFALLDAADASVGGKLQFTKDGLDLRGRSEAGANALREQWNSLKRLASSSGNPKEISEAYRRLMANVRVAIIHAGDTSNLILDPDLDSYYMMDVVLNALPQSLDRLSTIAVNAAENPNPSPEQRADLTVQAALLRQIDIEAMKSKLGFAFNEDKNFYGESSTLKMNVEPSLKGYLEANETLASLLQRAAMAPVPSEEITRAALEASASAIRLWQRSVTELDLLIQKRIAVITDARNQGLLLALGSLVLSTLLGFVILRGITRPVRSLNEAVVKVSAGDESARAQVMSGDEIGRLAGAFNTMVSERAAARGTLESENRRLQENIQRLLMVVADASDGNLGVRAPVTEGALGNVADALNMMFENVGELISNTKQVSSRVAEAAVTIKQSAADLAEGSEKQAAHLIQTSTSVRDLNEEAQSVAETCAEATSAAEKAQQAAERGAQAVREVIVDMDAIRESVQVNGKKIKRLGERSMEIGGILKTITEISAQTDMLALNASIEAGRAGEHGRGFSAVAEHVRTLAERAKKATQEIEKLVADIQAETSDAVTQVEGQTSEVERGVQKVALAGQALRDIVEVSSLSRDFADRISSTAAKQAARTAEMLGTVSLVANIAQDSRLQVGVTRTTSEELAVLSSELGVQLQSFSTGANGAN